MFSSKSKLPVFASRVLRFAPFALCLLASVHSATAASIDRKALVGRHNPVLTSAADLEFAPTGSQQTLHESGPAKRYTPLQVGNGNFAFSADISGLQSFIPCNTLSNWGWHSVPLPAGKTPEDFRWTDFSSDAGRKVPYPYVGLAQDAAYKSSSVSMDKEQKELGEWHRANPHRLNLGRLGFVLKKRDGNLCSLEDLKAVRQTLDLWSGVISSHYEIEGAPVDVTTVCHPSSDTIAVEVRSPLLAEGRLLIDLRFPYGDLRNQAPDVGNWEAKSLHETTLVQSSYHGALIERRLDASSYSVLLAWDAGRLGRLGQHHFQLEPVDTRGGAFAFVCRFIDGTSIAGSKAPSFTSVLQESRSHWAQFWTQGAAIDFSGSTDPRARELERRIVLSQYLLAIQEAGTLPPQEAGLVNNGWYGKFHLEMYWWHAAHWALWNRWSLLNPSLTYYQRILPAARDIAKRQGYEGLRWPKMVGPDGRPSPSSISPFLIWQQPHPLYFAELDYREHPTRETLLKWKDVVYGTADFMASFPVYDAARDRYVLGAPLKTVPENAKPEETRNPTFELAYWRFGLKIALQWQQRLGQAPNEKWQKVLSRLSSLPVDKGRYLLSETQPDTYENYHWEHPSLTGILGVLPGDEVDRAIMDSTLSSVLKTWDMKRVWGWDFPMLAMCAARLGHPDIALDMLFTDSPNFQFAPNGFATGGPWPYFPSNGGLLYAVAFMAAGWDGAPEKNAPGFPSDGSWIVRHEGLRRAP